ncbi:MAG: glycosyltransferase family 4 protein [Actinomycetota bacterium]
MRILLVSNDFPPRVGGIQVYLDNIYRRLAGRHSVTVLAPAYPGDVSWDIRQPFRVIRYPGAVYWPTPALARRVQSLARDVDVVAFGAALPMNFTGHRVRKPIVIHMHGFEVGAARLPGGRSILRSAASHAQIVTVVSEYCGRVIGAALDRRMGRHMPRIEMLKTGVDLDLFHPGVDGSEVRKRYGLEGRPVVGCISRLVDRKGQDQILKAMPAILRTVPDAVALIVGGGPERDALERLSREMRLASHVVFAGEVPWRDLPPHYAAADVFAMPCRSRKAGLEVEGLGLVYLEAQACGKPAITGDSGGAPEAVIPGETGFVVPGRDTRELSRVVSLLLSDPSARARMGERGRAFVEQEHRWDRVVERYESMLGTLL